MEGRTHGDKNWIKQTCKPSSVSFPCGKDGSHLSSPDVTTKVMRPTRGQAGRPYVPLFGLAPDGVYPADRSPGRWWALTPPFHPYPADAGRYVSVALSVGSPLLGVTQHPARWSSDFPPRFTGRLPGLLDPVIV